MKKKYITPTAMCVEVHPKNRVCFYTGSGTNTKGIPDGNYITDPSSIIQPQKSTGDGFGDTGFWGD